MSYRRNGLRQEVTEAKGRWGLGGRGQEKAPGGRGGQRHGHAPYRELPTAVVNGLLLQVHFNLKVVLFLLGNKPCGYFHVLKLWTKADFQKSNSSCKTEGQSNHSSSMDDRSSISVPSRRWGTGPVWSPFVAFGTGAIK